MKIMPRISLLILALAVSACESATAPDVVQTDALTLTPADAAPHMAAAGTFDQTTITSLEFRQAGPNTILDQTSAGSVTGTLTGSYTDELKVVIHSDGRFNAHFTIRCQCMVAGQYGVIDLVASDTGELVSPTVASFKGRAVITGGTADLADLHGVLEIDGTIDLMSGLATYTYAGRIH
ncbi:MAG TPA: hypothetical protein VK912_07210 [Longimicrobiales bacterium]|nr:hypothetical protein [Longimicrobiales bacterium]